jgi:hypothetical protein
MEDVMTEPVVVVDPVVDEPKADANGKYPESVPYTKYIGVKEKFTRVETELKGQVSKLEEQLKAAPNAEEFTKTKGELDALKAELTTAKAELSSFKESSLTAKREALVLRGIPKEKVSGLTEKEMDTLASIVGSVSGILPKPRPDFGGGGGGTGVVGSTKDRIRKGFETLHPVN